MTAVVWKDGHRWHVQGVRSRRAAANAIADVIELRLPSTRRQRRHHARQIVFPCTQHEGAYCESALHRFEDPWHRTSSTQPHGIPSKLRAWAKRHHLQAPDTLLMWVGERHTPRHWSGN